MRTPHTKDTTDLGRPSRRTLARGMAWTVPVVVVAVPTPVRAASSGSGTITGACTTPQAASFTLSVTGSSATSVQVVFTQSVSGQHFVTTPAGWTLVATDGQVSTFTAPVTGGSASGVVTVTYGLDSGATGVVTATISAAPPFGAGDQVASVRKIRQGATNSYDCTVLS